MRTVTKNQGIIRLGISRTDNRKKDGLLIHFY